MAAIGMRYLVGAVISGESDGALPTYDKGMKIGRAISANVSLRRNDSELYADDVLAESDNTITGGDVDITVAEILDEVAAAIFGDTKDEETGEYYDSDASSPYIGLGYMREQKYKGVSSFKCTWLYKVQLAPAEESGQTKGETTSFQTQRVTGEILGVSMADGKSRFRARKEFKTAAEGIAWLNSKANYSETAA